MSTVADFIADVLVQIGELGQGETPSPEDLSNGLLRLNGFTGVLTSQRVGIPSVTRVTYTLVSGQASYAIGPTGSTGMTALGRPVKMQGAECILPIVGGGNYYAPCNMLNSKQYEQLRNKDLQDATIVDIYEEGGNVNYVFYCHPVPNRAAQIVASLWLPFATYANTAATFNIGDYPTGYYEMFVWNVGAFIQNGYGRLSQLVQQNALATLQAIQKENAQLMFEKFGESRTLDGAQSGIPEGGPVGQ